MWQPMLFDLMQKEWKTVGWEQAGAWGGADPLLSRATHSYTRRELNQQPFIYVIGTTALTALKKHYKTR